MPETRGRCVVRNKIHKTPKLINLGVLLAYSVLDTTASEMSPRLFRLSNSLNVVLCPDLRFGPTDLVTPNDLLSL